MPLLPKNMYEGFALKLIEADTDEEIVLISIILRAEDLGIVPDLFGLISRCSNKL